MVVNADECSAEGENLAEGCEYGGIDDSGGWNEEGDEEQKYAEKD